MLGDSKHRDMFTEGYRSLMGGILLMGVSLLVLGGLIFAYPELIGILAAAVILAAGVVVLYWALQIWRFKKHVMEVKADHLSEPAVYEVRGEGPDYTWRRITMILR